MNKLIHINLPASKSIANRALIIKALVERQNKLANDGLDISNLSNADDTQLLQNILNGFKATDSRLLATERGVIKIDAGMAGTAYRFLTAFLAIQQGQFLLTGHQRMKQRPILPLVNALQKLGANITYVENQGYPPLQITGTPLNGGSVEIDGSISSQFITALMLVAPYLKNGLIIDIKGGLVSYSYVQLTAEIMRHFGADVRLTPQKIQVKPKPYQAQAFAVENDWSSASYFYSIGALTGQTIQLNKLHKNSLQGDVEIVNWFKYLGVNTQWINPNTLVLTPVKREWNYINIDFINQPDMAQTIIALCVGLGLEGDFKGLQTLKIKETNRVVALQTEVAKFGYALIENGEVYTLKSTQTVSKTEKISIKTYNDHRMAMAFAPLQFIYPNLQIENPNVVSKSFPNFWKEFKKTNNENKL